MKSGFSLFSLFLILLSINSSMCLRTGQVLKASSGNSLLSTQSLTPSDEKRTVILLKENGKAVPFTSEKSGLSTPEFEKNPPAEIEEGVGPAVSVDYSPAMSLDANEKSQPAAESSKTIDTDEDLKVEYSDVHPVYVKPPTDFKPRIFPNRRADGIAPGSKPVEVEVTIAPPARPYPYRYPNGLSSWLTGGIRGLQRGGFWESLASDESLHGYKPDREPVDIASWFMKPLLPLLPQKVIVPPSSSNYRSSFIGAKRKVHSASSSPSTFATGLPYPLSSWLFGGSHGFPSLTPWDLPSPFFIENIEFVPLSKDSTPEAGARNKVSSVVNQDLMVSDQRPSPASKYNFHYDYYRRPVVTAAFLFDTEPDHLNFVNVEN